MHFVCNYIVNLCEVMLYIYEGKKLFYKNNKTNCKSRTISHTCNIISHQIFSDQYYQSFDRNTLEQSFSLNLKKKKKHFQYPPRVF